MNDSGVSRFVSFISVFLLAIASSARPANADVETADIAEHAGQKTRAMSELFRPSPYFMSGRIIGYRLYPGSVPELLGELGFVAGDLVTAVDGLPLTDPKSSMDVLKMISSGQTVTVDIERGGVSRQIQVTAPSVSATAPAFQPAKDVRPISDIFRGSPRFVNARQRGYVVYPGDEPQIFSDLGLQAADFLTEINGESLDRPDHAYELFKQIARGEKVVLTVERDGETSQLEVQVN